MIPSSLLFILGGTTSKFVTQNHVLKLKQLDAETSEILKRVQDDKWCSL